MNDNKPSPIALAERPAAPTWWQATGAVLRLSGFSMLRGRRGLLLALLMLTPLVPAGVSLAFRHGHRGTEGFINIVMVGYLSVLLPLAFLFLGCAAVGDEVEGRTITYLLIRPIPRATILAGRFASYLMCSVVLIVPSVVLVFLLSMSQFSLATIIDRLPLLGEVVLVLLLAAFAYGAFFLFLSVLVPWPVLIGIALTFGYEAIWIRVAPGSMKLLSFVYHLHTVAYHLTGEAGFISATVARALFGEAEDPALGPSLRVLILAPLVFLLLAWARFRRKEFAFN
ncbi:MAG: ABC transporter permease [Planctomycetota bacterium]